MITPDDVFDVLEEDVKAADMILWIGMSFSQSASTAYFRRVRHYLQVSIHIMSHPLLVLTCNTTTALLTHVSTLNVTNLLALARRYVAHTISVTGFESS